MSSLSPLALTAATVVAITGVTTAWLHLKRISALYTIRRTATMELAFAALVLIVTSVLVTLPSPR